MREAEKRGIKADESLLDKKPEDEVPAEPEIEEMKDAVAEPAAPEAPVSEPVKEEPSKAEPVKEEATIKAAEVKPAEPKKPDEPVKPAIASAEETFDDFSEFLDDGNK